MKKYLYALASLSLVGALVGCDNEDSCDDNFDCPGTQICNLDTNVCEDVGGDTSCVMDEECGAYACDVEAEICFDSCTTNDECSTGAECSDAGLCVTTGAASYDTVLLVSRTPDDPDERSCRADNPGPDIDTVELIRAGEASIPTVVSAANLGGYCASTPPPTDPDPGVILEGRTSIPDILPGLCEISPAADYYYWMGMGQPFEPGETLDAETGFVALEYANAFEDGDIVKVWEVNSNDGDGEVCTNDEMGERAGDIYSVYIVAAGTTIEAGVELVAPNFIHLGESNGIVERVIILD